MSSTDVEVSQFMTLTGNSNLVTAASFLVMSGGCLEAAISLFEKESEQSKSDHLKHASQPSPETAVSLFEKDSTSFDSHNLKQCSEPSEHKEEQASTKFPVTGVDSEVSQFMSLTGSSDVLQAAILLEMSGGDLEAAVGLSKQVTKFVSFTGSNDPAKATYYLELSSGDLEFSVDLRADHSDCSPPIQGLRYNTQTLEFSAAPRSKKTPFKMNDFNLLDLPLVNDFNLLDFPPETLSSIAEYVGTARSDLATMALADRTGKIADAIKMDWTCVTCNNSVFLPTTTTKTRCKLKLGRLNVHPFLCNSCGEKYCGHGSCETSWVMCSGCGKQECSRCKSNLSKDSCKVCIDSNFYFCDDCQGKCDWRQCEKCFLKTCSLHCSKCSYCKKSHCSRCVPGPQRSCGICGKVSCNAWGDHEGAYCPEFLARPRSRKRPGGMMCSTCFLHPQMYPWEDQEDTA